MWELLGLDAKSQARGELGALDDRRQGFESWDLGDRFRSLVTGVSREELEKLSGQIADEKLEAIYGPQAAANAENLSSLTSSYQGVDNKTEAEIKAQIARDAQRGRALQQTLATNPEFNISAIGPNATSGQILQAGARAERDRIEQKEQKAEDKADRKYKDSQDLLMLQLSNQSADRAADREDRRAQQAYQNRKLDMQEARLDRKDRQAAIQQMMAGLAQLGASIAI